MITGIRKVMQNEVYFGIAIKGVVVSMFSEVYIAEGVFEERDQKAADKPSIIRRTKLHRPLFFPYLVSRSDMMELLDESRRRPVTLISSVAGYGKSQLPQTASHHVTQRYRTGRIALFCRYGV